MDFYEEKYTPKVKIYYSLKVEQGFCKNIIDYFWMDKIKFEEEIELIKDSNSRKIKVFKLKYNKQTYYLKKYNFKRIDKKIQNNFLRRPEGIRNLKNANKLLAADILTARPLFSAIKRNLICRDSIFVTKAAPGIELDEYIKEKGLSGNQRLIKALGRLWGKFIGNNFIHQDPGLDNIFIDTSQAEIKITLIDIDSVYSLLFLPKVVALHTLARIVYKFYKNLFTYQHQLFSEKDQVLFLEEFIKNCNKKFDFNRLNYRLNKLIVKKMIKKGRKNIVQASDNLSNIF